MHSNDWSRLLTERQREVLSIVVENKVYRNRDSKIPELAAQMGIAPAAVAKHLLEIEKTALLTVVVSPSEQGKRVYERLELEPRPENKQTAEALDRQTITILRFLRDHPDARSNEIAEELGLSDYTTGNSLRVLIAIQLVTKQRDDRCTRGHRGRRPREPRRPRRGPGPEPREDPRVRVSVPKRGRRRTGPGIFSPFPGGAVQGRIRLDLPERRRRQRGRGRTDRRARGDSHVLPRTWNRCQSEDADDRRHDSVSLRPHVARGPGTRGRRGRRRDHESDERRGNPPGALQRALGGRVRRRVPREGGSRRDVGVRPRGPILSVPRSGPMVDDRSGASVDGPIDECRRRGARGD